MTITKLHFIYKCYFSYLNKLIVLIKDIFKKIKNKYIMSKDKQIFIIVWVYVSTWSIMKLGAQVYFRMTVFLCQRVYYNVSCCFFNKRFDKFNTTL